MSCPDDVGLERLLLGFASDEERTHLASCATCHRRLAEMEAQGEDFHRAVFPRTVDSVIAAHTETRRPRWLGWSLSAAAAAAVTALLLLLLSPEAPRDYVGLKGGALGLKVYTLDDTGAPVLIDDGARVSPVATLRFRVAPTQPCHLWLLSIDEAGTVSRLFPPTGDSALITSETTLLGGATLDGATGLERLVAVCTSAPTPYDAVAAATHRALDRRIAKETRVPLEGLQATILLEKAGGPDQPTPDR